MMIRRLALVIVVISTVIAAASGQDRPVSSDQASVVLRNARALAARKNPGEALAVLERFLSPGAANSGEPDVAVLHLTAARIAADSAKLDQARIHLDAAERIAAGSAFQPQPLLGAYLSRDLAVIRNQLGDLASAERLFSAALPILETADLLAAIDVANARGLARMNLLRIGEAAKDFDHCLDLITAARSKGLAPSREVAVAVAANLALVRAEAGEKKSVQTAAARARSEAGSDWRLLGAADLAEARASLQSLDTSKAEKLLGDIIASPKFAADPLRGHALLLLANARFDRGRMSEAAEAAADAVETYRVTLGERDPAFARAQHTLGTAQAELGNEVGAAAALQSASGIWRTLLGEHSVPFLATEVERGWLYFRIGNLTEAENLANSALSGFDDKPPPDQRPQGLALVLRGLVAEARGQPDEAASRYRRAQVLIANARGPSSPDLGFSLVRLGRLLTRTAQYPEAEQVLDRAIAIYRGPGNTDSVRLADAVTARSELRRRKNDCPGAVEDARQALTLLRGRIDALELTGVAGAQTQRLNVREAFVAQARLLLGCGPDDPTMIEDAFRASQEVLVSRAGEALRLTAVKLQARGDALASLLRVRDEASDALRQANAQILVRASETGAEVAETATQLRTNRDKAAEHRDAADKAIKAGFPEAADLLHPHTVTIANVRASLDKDEALLAPVLSDEGMLLWVITADEAKALVLPTRSATIANLVGRVRAGVDVDAVSGVVADLPAFDVEGAQQLYAALVAPAEGTELLRSARHLILIPDGTLQSLSPHLLVDNNRRWLVERYAISVEPSISAAIAARAAAERPSHAPIAFLGVGNPVFSGEGSVGWRPVSDRSFELRRRLRTLPVLTDAEVEIKAIAALYGTAGDHILLGEKATVQDFQAQGPGQFRTIVFSTHALMAGGIGELDEASIVLAPEAGNASSDGLLKASAIATLDLDADLVVLSGCNTAATEGGPYAEGLSGLARAFLHAGARSLLVSHWSVLSEVTAKVVTRFVTAEQAAPKGRRADALRTAMLEMIQDPDPMHSHPVSWAPFVIVGR